jgi:hypothetical protein
MGNYRPIMCMPRTFFEIVLSVVKEMCRVSGEAPDEIFLSYTPFYKLFNIDLSFSPGNSLWLEFMEGYTKSTDPLEYVYSYYLRRQDLPSTIEPKFGCFLYEVGVGGVIHPHFTPYHGDGVGPLDSRNSKQRIRELRSMFSHIKANELDTVEVAGRSWLYNIDAYRRLYPEPYVQSAYAVQAPHIERLVSHMCLWGQLLDSNGDIRPKVRDCVLDKARKAQSLQEVTEAFPHRVLRVRCAIEEFYEFYGI